MIDARMVRRTGLGMAALLVAVAFSLAGLLPAVVQAREDNSFSRANALLFLTNHLKNVNKPAILQYAFVKRGPLEAPYKGSIDMAVSVIKGGEKNVKFKYFTGARSRYIPPVSDVHGNPIISLFLQRDVTDMQRRTGGSARYFQDAIKVALENGAKVEQIKLNYRGHTIDGTRITIAPYVKDPHRNELGQFAKKHYMFKLSKAVPGEVYQLRTVVPAEPGQHSDQMNALVEETLTFAGTEPLQNQSENK
jgi:hypothetical protein